MITKKDILFGLPALVVGIVIGFIGIQFYPVESAVSNISISEEVNASGLNYKIPVTHYPEGADRETYMIIGTTSEPASTVEWGKDKNHAYYNGYPITDADVGSFVAVRNEESEMICAKDEVNVWFYEGRHGRHSTANSDSVVATGYYCKDETHVWMGTTELEGADAQTFQAYKEEGYFAQDKNHIWAMGDIVEGADKATFKVLEVPYFDSEKNMYVFAEDKNQKYNDRGWTYPLVQ